MAGVEPHMAVELDIKWTILEAIGNTPLVRLNKVIGDTKARFWSSASS